MYSIEARITSDGYDVFKDGQLMGSPKTDHELELRLNFHGILEGICDEFMQRLKANGQATEEMPNIKFRQI